MTQSEFASDARKQLAFAESVQREIAPLLFDRGFLCVDQNDYEVRFASDVVNVAIFHERVSYEIDLLVGRCETPRERYTLEDLLRVLLGAGHQEPTFFQASTRDRVEEFVATIGAYLRHHGDAVLAGDPGVYLRIAEEARSHYHEIARRERNESVLRDAALAWRDRDYSRVCRLLGSIETELPKLERERLRYSRESLTGETGV